MCEYHVCALYLSTSVLFIFPHLLSVHTSAAGVRSPPEVCVARACVCENVCLEGDRFNLCWKSVLSGGFMWDGRIHTHKHIHTYPCYLLGKVNKIPATTFLPEGLQMCLYAAVPSVIVWWIGPCGCPLPSHTCSSHGSTHQCLWGSWICRWTIKAMRNGNGFGETQSDWFDI